MNEYELFSQVDLDRTLKDYEYTRNALSQIRSIIRSEEFKAMDADAIYQYLLGGGKFVSFKDYLKRYIYQKAGIEDEFSLVTDDVYKSILSESFEETRTPRSLTPTTKKWSVTLRDWLTQDSVRRSTIFLLGFGLHMNPMDVSQFLSIAAREEDFRFDSAEETIYWYCYRSGFGYPKAQQLLQQYSTLPGISPGQLHISKAEDLLFQQNFHLEREQDLLLYLSCLKGSGEQRQNQKPFEWFCMLTGQAAEKIAEYYNMDEEETGGKKSWTASDISSGDLEKWICSGIPVNRSGNLEKASASRLGKLFGNRRLSRQRIDDLLKEKHKVERFDLITMKFFLAALSDTDDPAQRYGTFVQEINQILRECHFSDLYPANPYEAFILMCLMTDGPLSVYADIWEMSYDRNV